MIASLSYSLRPGQGNTSSGPMPKPSAMPSQVWRWRFSVPVITASKRMPRSRQYSPSRTRLLAAQFAELVVVGGAEAGLPVAHEVEGSHARDSANRGRWPRSRW